MSGFFKEWKDMVGVGLAEIRLGLSMLSDSMKKEGK